jgi:hypothetical protein
MTVSTGRWLGLLGTAALLMAVAVPAGGAVADAKAGSPPGTRIDPAPGLPHAPAAPRAGSPWQLVTRRPQFNPGAMLLLTNGTVLVQNQGPMNNGSNKWWVLTPSSSGSYVDGRWSKVASLPASYAPLYFASAILPDGRVIIMGGEYNLGEIVWTNKGAIFDPVADTWTSVSPPSGSEWTRIGDAPSTVLANGTFMLGASGFSGTTAQALLNESKLTWRATGTGKADGNGEEGWSLLPDGKVLTVDTTMPRNTEIYTPSTGSWTSAGQTPVPLTDSDGEVGPQILRPDGTVFAVGAAGPNAIYNTGTGKWSAGPEFPKVGGKRLDAADGPAAVLPDGDVLVAASPGEYTPPTKIFDFNGSKLTAVPDPLEAAHFASNDAFMMVLPTGQVLFNDRIGDLEVYTPTGKPKAAWLPSITSVPTALSAGGTYKLKGKQLNGLTQAAAYGDDYQDATNYPLVRLTNKKTGFVVYARTFGMTSMTVAPAASSSVKFALPAGLKAATYSLVVVANGLASAPVTVTVKA